MVEREALLPRDRPLVAAVIYNRLRLGMPLGIDSTIRYALHDYTKPLTEAQLQIDSPYNTRTHHGLPPTPISNPGLAAIDAAAHPAHVSYLYYVNGADGCGELVFSTSYAQFERNAAAYQRALAANGGRVPSLPEAVAVARLGVLGWPVAHSRSPAMHTAALAALGLRGLELPAAAGAAGAVRARPRARCGAAGFARRERDDPPQAGRARARRQRERGGARDRRGEHAQLRRRRDDRGGEHRRAGSDRRDGALAARACSALVLGAGGSARAAVWALRDAGAREVSVWNRTACARRELAQALGARAVARAGAGRPARQLHRPSV